MSRILIAMSAADTWMRTDGLAYPTGYWAEELAAPHAAFVGAGHTVDFASPGGVLQPLDTHSATRRSPVRGARARRPRPGGARGVRAAARPREG